MSDYLIFKGKETKSVNSVEIDLPNYEVSQVYTNFKEISATILHTTGTLDLGTPHDVPTTTPFIVLISSAPINLTFQDADSSPISSLTGVYYIAGNIKGFNFALNNTGANDANITFRIYW